MKHIQAHNVGFMTESYIPKNVNENSEAEIENKRFNDEAAEQEYAQNNRNEDASYWVITIPHPTQQADGGRTEKILSVLKSEDANLKVSKTGIPPLPGFAMLEVDVNIPNIGDVVKKLRAAGVKGVFYPDEHKRTIMLSNDNEANPNW